MILVHSYPIAIMLCIVTMLCWGSWANTTKMVPRSYGFPLFYWDQAIGYLLLPLIVGLTFGSFGSEGRSLLADLQQGSASSFLWAILGGFVFNLANILFTAAVDIAGMAIAFPIGIGIALAVGVLINYIAQPSGNPVLIFTGVALILTAILLNALAYRNVQREANDPGQVRKGLALAISGGILMGLFYYLVQRSLSPSFTELTPGKFGPYAAVLMFSAGSFVSNLIFTTFLMSHPPRGEKVTYTDYFRPGRFGIHMIGIAGGLINGLGTTSNFIASKAASPAIAYGLGQGGTMIAAIWGVFVWKEFRGASKGTLVMIAGMFVCFLAGLLLLIVSMLG
ncbi:MAG: GRP family sugar transporter [Acidobacteriaceae bacterium]|nr:GRP family sugar transporter [Acidobacteriaceae bacterium]